jgi:hypothetical protein
MAETITIEKSPALEKSQDYAYLRVAGLDHLQKLGSRLWTDYNIHDPGIMIMEMVAYAISDLGYRTAYDIQDILGLEEGDGYFHTARNILTVNPTTMNDYRKLLMDVEGIKNAWLMISNQNEIPIYTDTVLGQLTYVPPAIADPETARLVLNGLYNVLLEFEEDDEFGDLNNPVIKRNVTVDAKSQTIEYTFPHWDELLAGDAGHQKLVRAFVDRGVITSIVVGTITFDSDERGYIYPITVGFDYERASAIPDPGFACCVDLPLDEFGEASPADDSMPLTGIIDSDTLTFTVIARYPGRADLYEAVSVDLIENNTVGRIIDFYRQKIGFTLDIVDHVWCKLLDHRNLCEDFLQVKSLETEEIAICADIEIKADADVDRVMADILFQLDEFISPPVNFYTIEQLLDEGLKPDDIFNGPALDHGFIKEEELDLAVPKTVIHTSDLINIIMDVEGVVAVKMLQVANYLDGVPQTTGEYWSLCLTNDGLHVPKLSADKSKILFFKDILPYRANMDQVEQYIAELRSRAHTGRLKEIDLDLEEPEGSDLDPEVYSTIQNGFPLTFGTTKYGIPGDPDDLRKAQAKQLKAYLLFFEQLLANYLSQLGHVKDLFAMDDTGEARTYFTQTIEDPKDIDTLLNRFGPDFAPVAAWLKEIEETTVQYEERKNRFLDHLMARFAESFSEYALLMYALRDEFAAAELIADKQAFLVDYPNISRDRGKAFNYRPTRNCDRCFPDMLWNTNNVSGFKKRVERLLGMAAYERRNLTGHMFEVRVTTSGMFVWQLMDPDNPTNVLLTSVEYETRDSANFMITYAITMVEEGRLKKDSEGPFDHLCCKPMLEDGTDAPTNPPIEGFVLLNKCDDVIACSKDYDLDTVTLDADFQKVYDYVMGFCDLENFHLIEHILLRPKFAGSDDIPEPDRLLPICVEPIADGNSDSLHAEFYIDIRGQWRFRVRSGRGYVALRSEAAFDTYESVQAEFRRMDRLRRSEANFTRHTTVDGRYYFNIVERRNSRRGEIRATSHFYATAVERESALQLLLVTGNEESDLLATDHICAEFADPYSFRISVILPSWAGRFRDINYRRLVEKTLRMEAPAHIFLRICWIDRDQMAKFECAYMKWLLANGSCENTPEEVSDDLNRLIDRLFTLENIYPVATLHDCDDDSGNDAQVVLNYTSLGTL